MEHESAPNPDFLLPSGRHAMIHFTCDGCQRAIDPLDETRYVVRVEVYAAVEDDGAAAYEEADNLQGIQDLLERMEDVPSAAEDDLYREARFDLCMECREQFLKNPLGRAAARSLGVSNN